MFAIHRILVPIDFSPCAEVAARYAMFLARQFQAELAFAHVIAAGTGWSPASPFLTSGDVSALRFAEALEKLNNFVGGIDPAHALEVEKHIELGDPGDRLMEMVRAGQFDLIVMGTHGRTGMSYLLLGGLAKALVRCAPCPVLTLRADDSGGRPRVPNDDAEAVGYERERELHA